jgi:hypothetical protein
MHQIGYIDEIGVMARQRMIGAFTMAMGTPGQLTVNGVALV